jgi:hypothetical protein
MSEIERSSLGLGRIDLLQGLPSQRLDDLARRCPAS